jgi:acyl-CoA synthetase (NDP forming)
MGTLDPLFRPWSVALLGVSDDPTSKMAGNLMPVIAASGFTGQVSPVNPKRDSIGGMKAYPSVLDIPGKVDLALITLPRSAVIAAIDECAVALGKRASYERLRPLLLEADKERSITVPCKNAPELSGTAQLLETECRAVLRRYGIPSPIEEIAGNADQAIGAASRIGFPVVIKILSRDVLHKTEAGGVVLDIRDTAGVRAACARIYANVAEGAVGARTEGLLIQAMAPNHSDPS